MTITVSTPQGQAYIETDMPWTDIGPYRVTGPGKAAARNWIENAYGAFGHFIDTAAAPMDLHAAAMTLAQEPQGDVTFVAIDDDPGLPYDDGISDADRRAGAVT